MNMRIPVAVIVFATLLFAYIGMMVVKTRYDKIDPNAINSFAACVDAGNPVMESYPRQCTTQNGRTFTEPVKLNDSIVE